MVLFRYAYGNCDRGKSTLFDGLVKYDSKSGTAIYWEEHAHSPGEPVFVADPHGTEEDDGVLLTVVLDGKLKKSYLLVLSAKDMKEVARAEMDSVVTFGFHGAYFGKASGDGPSVDQ